MTENKDTSGTAGTVYGDGKLARLRKKRDELCVKGVYFYQEKISKLSREIATISDKRTISSAYLSRDKYNHFDCREKKLGIFFGAIIH